jgi:hypothetical protein
MPVARTKEPEIEPAHEPKQTIPTQSLSKVASAHDRGDSDEDKPARGAAQAAAAATFGVGVGAAAAVAATSGGGPPPPGPAAASSGSIRAIVQYDYEKAEENEIELVEGQVVTNIEMVDEDWWMGTNSKGESGLFPSNYVEVVEGDEEEAPAAPAPAAVAHQAPPSPPPVAAAPAGGAVGKTATAQYEYDAAEENELSFPDGAKITNVVCYPSL